MREGGRRAGRALLQLLCPARAYSRDVMLSQRCRWRIADISLVSGSSRSPAARCGSSRSPSCCSSLPRPATPRASSAVATAPPGGACSFHEFVRIAAEVRARFPHIIERGPRPASTHSPAGPYLMLTNFPWMSGNSCAFELFARFKDKVAHELRTHGAKSSVQLACFFGTPFPRCDRLLRTLAKQGVIELDGRGSWVVRDGW